MNTIEVSLYLSYAIYALVFSLFTKLIFSLLYISAPGFINYGKKVFPFRTISNVCYYLSYFDKDCLMDYFKQFVLYCVTIIVYTHVSLCFVKYVDKGNIYNIICVLLVFIGADLFFFSKARNSKEENTKE